MADKYSISLWEDQWNPETQRYEEKKLFIIGANGMTASCRAHEPKMVENINGTNKFTFTMYMKSDGARAPRDEAQIFVDNTMDYLIDTSYYFLIFEKAEFVKDTNQFYNPFIPYLVNERKIKVYWNDKWFDLVIKDIKEDSTKHSITYTCEDQHIAELSKNGFNLVFDTELENNQGTACELGARVLDSTDWQVVGSNGMTGVVAENGIDVEFNGYEVEDFKSDVIRQMNNEAIYECTTGISFTAKNSLTGDTTEIPSGARIAVYYTDLASYFETKDASAVPGAFQFAYTSDSQWKTEEGKQLVTNFSYFEVENASYVYNSDNDSITIQVNEIDVCSIRNNQAPSKDYRADHLIRKQMSVQDKVSKKYVNVYETIPLRGDFNGDGVVDWEDAVYYAFWMYFPENYPMRQSPAVIPGTTWDEANQEFIYTSTSMTSPDINTDKQLNHFMRYVNDTTSTTLQPDSTMSSLIYYGWEETEFKSPQSITNLVQNPDTFRDGTGWHYYSGTLVDRKYINSLENYVEFGSNYHFSSTSTTSTTVTSASKFKPKLISYSRTRGDIYQSGSQIRVVNWGVSGWWNQKWYINTNDPITVNFIPDYKVASENYIVNNDISGNNTYDISWVVKNQCSFTIPGGNAGKWFVRNTYQALNDSGVNGGGTWVPGTPTTVTYFSYGASGTMAFDPSESGWHTQGWTLTTNIDTFEWPNVSGQQNVFITQEPIDGTQATSVSVLGYYSTLNYSYDTTTPTNIPLPTDASPDNPYYLYLEQQNWQPLDVSDYGTWYTDDKYQHQWTRPTTVALWPVFPATGGDLSTYKGAAYLPMTTESIYINDGIQSQATFIPNGLAYGQEYILRWTAISVTNTSSTEFIYGTYDSDALDVQICNVMPLLNVSNDPNPIDDTPYFQLVSTYTSGIDKDGFVYWQGVYKYINSEPIRQEDLLLSNLKIVLTPKKPNFYLKRLEFYEAYKVGDEYVTPNNLLTNTVSRTLYKFYNHSTSKAKELKDIKYDYCCYTEPSKEGTTVKLPHVDLKPVYRPDYEKFTSITGKESNRFNHLQSIAENFKCWVQFKVEHDETGAIKSAGDGKMSKFVRFVRQVGEDTGLGFYYGQDLKSITRNIKSNQIVTKTIVKPNNNQYAESGVCTIQRSKSNYSKANYILNFDYFTDQGMLDREQLYNDLYVVAQGADTNQSLGYLKRLRELYTTYDSYAETLNEKALELAKQEGYYKTYSEAAIAAFNAQEDAEAKLATYAGFTQFFGHEISVLNYISSRISSGKNDTIAKRYLLEYNNAIEKKLESQELAADAQTLVNTLKQKVEEYTQLCETTTESVRRLDLQFWNRYGHYLLEGTWTSNQYIDDDLYYLDAEQVAYTSARPQVSYSVNVIRVNGVEDIWFTTNSSSKSTVTKINPFAGKVFHPGDIAYVVDPEFFNSLHREPVVITEITSNFEAPEKDSFKVQNYRTQFEDLFHRISATTQQLKFNEGEYARAVRSVDVDGKLSLSTLQKSLVENANYIASSQNNAIYQDASGITVSSLTEPNHKVKINSMGLFITSDGGNVWLQAIKGDGIVSDYLTAGQINVERIMLINGDVPTFRWDKDGITAYNTSDDTPKLDQRGFARFNQFGIFGTQNPNYTDASGIIVNKDFTTVTNIMDNADFALTYNGFQFTGTSGTDNRIRTIINNNGIEIIKQATTTVPGDFDGDGVVTDQDATYLLFSLYFPDSYPLNQSGDVNQDGVVDKQDAFYLLHHFYFPEDYPLPDLISEKLFSVDTHGDLTIAGTINARAGQVGAWEIGAPSWSGTTYGQNGLKTQYKKGNEDYFIAFMPQNVTISSEDIGQTNPIFAYGLQTQISGETAWLPITSINCDGSITTPTLYVKNLRADNATIESGLSQITDFSNDYPITVNLGHSSTITETEERPYLQLEIANTAGAYTDGYYFYSNTGSGWRNHYYKILSNDAFTVNFVKHTQGDIYLLLKGIYNNPPLEKWSGSGSMDIPSGSMGGYIVRSTPDDQTDESKTAIAPNYVTVTRYGGYTFTLTADGHLTTVNATINGASLNNCYDGDGVSVTSDRTKKHQIESLPSTYISLLDNLTPVRFKYDDGTSDRYHTGFIAQDLLTAIEGAGLTSQDVGALVIRDRDTDHPLWTIRYNELVALNTAAIQDLRARVAALEART